MRPADLWKHSAFRLVFLVSLFVLATLMLAIGIGYGLMKSQLSARQDARVTEIFTAITETILQGDETEMIEAIETRIKASPERASAYRLRDPIGRVLASNIGEVALPEGWSTVPATLVGIATDESYRLYSGKAGRYSLVVGLTNADMMVLGKDLAAAFGWAALAALLATLAVGTVLAIRVQAQIKKVEAASARIAQGDLSARLPITGRRDDLDQISQVVNAALDRLASLVEAMRHASTDIAHDLRTPLNRLRIHIENAERKVAAGESPADEFSAALAQSELIDQTFAALLRIAQIEAGARREKFAPVDLAALVEDVADVYTDVAVDSGMSLSRDTRGPAWVMGDRELLTQGFANLIENAIRHCPAGTAIVCTIQAKGDHVTASVSDNGPGIPAAERDKVLRRLYRLEKSRSTEGTGLGLALVKAVADLHGAELILTDTAPGLRVSFRFARNEGAA